MPKDPFYLVEEEAERAFLVAVEPKGKAKAWSAEDSLNELTQLADTAGAQVVGRMVQRLQRPTGNYYLGKGKLLELIGLREELNYDLVIFDDELTPTQQGSLVEALQVKVIDRSALILDIFAEHAQTHEGRLQVELAQNEYLLPRLAGQWSHLERLGGGIGTRGPGETQLETDRRLARQKIQRLKEELEEVRRHRALYRRQRQEGGLALVSLIGYTNAGKSTLLNTLAGAEVLVEDKLFATLDPTTRRLRLPNGQEILVTDTVGFIQKLPPTVVAAFRATLEELEEADLLIHVIDITHHNARQQAETVERTLAELGLADKPRLAAYNKVDLLMDGKADLEDYAIDLAEEGRHGVPISAERGWGLDRLLEAVSVELAGQMLSLAVLIPYERSELVNLFRQSGSVDREEYSERGTIIRGRIPKRLEPVFDSLKLEA